ncbi:MAG: hypothetical protein GY861_11355 [bacterium]|nr:hypothetical protein [bacterium]
MSHYDVHFNTAGQQKREDAFKAIEDWREGLTNNLYDYACDCIGVSQFYFGALFAGVQGWPVTAIWEQMKDDCRSMTT